MQQSEIEQVRSRLEQLRQETLDEKDAAFESTEPIELDQARVGRLSRMDSMQQQAMAQEQDRRRDTMLKRIEGAFQRLERGNYGLCVKCTKSIEEKRVDFDPTVFFCQQCASLSEKR